MRPKYRRYLGLFILPILLLLPAGALNWLFLENTGELTDIETVVRIQQEEGGLYGTALHPNSYPYKLELLRARQPEVAVIGSSRVLEFRQSAFSAPFVNLGRAVNYPAEAVALVRDMLAIHRPDIVLFGVDHYWLNPAFTTALNFDSHALRGGDLSPDALITPWRWLTEDRLDWPTYFAAIAGDLPRDTVAGRLIGVRAIIDGSGFGPDGSMYYDHFAYGRRTAEDEGFRDIRARLQSGTRQFRHGGTVDAGRVDELRETIAILRAAGVRPVVFIPPMAPTALEIMDAQGENYAYVAAARAAIVSLDAPVYDMLDIAPLGADDCEFVDGFHAGEVASLRILAAIGDDPRSGLAPRLDEAFIERTIARRAGFVQADTRFRRPGEREVDFLAVGCPKREAGPDVSETPDSAGNPR